MANRWKIQNSGIVSDVAENTIPHMDHLEMSGQKVSQYLQYGINEAGEVVYTQSIVFPLLRRVPNNTYGSWIEDFDETVFPEILIDGVSAGRETGDRISFASMLKLEGHLGALKFTRTFFPSRKIAAAIQKVEMENTGDSAITVEVKPHNEIRYRRGVYGMYVLNSHADYEGVKNLEPGAKLTFYVSITGRRLREPAVEVYGPEEENQRLTFWGEMQDTLRLRTPDPLFNQAFDFTKLRTTESVFNTHCGLLHSPGGLHYYAAIWTNDQCEYAAPFFPWLGNEDAIQAILNAFRLYRNFMGPEYTCIPTSIISEGIDIWEGAGDRGDCAMYAYGASRFALALGREAVARELWEPIKWCLEYSRRQLNEHGVVASDSDELENRFPSGDANLNTSSLCYGALLSAADLGDELGESKQAEIYRKAADELRENIEKFFGARVRGFDTYRYYEGNDCLRAWLCTPLSMGIFDRKDETISALFSKNLWTEDGLATQEGDKVFWDRPLLYAFRGVMYAGETDRAMPYLTEYTNRRLLGEHVPYPFEAWPENDQQQMAAESALYCRIYVEGLFGLVPRGLHRFACRPSLPGEWNEASLENIRAFGTAFNVRVNRENGGYKVVTESPKGVQEQFCRAGDEVIFAI